MAGLVPATHEPEQLGEGAVRTFCTQAGMGGRDKPGHDGREPGKGLERGEMAGLVSFAVLVSFVSLFLPFD